MTSSPRSSAADSSRLLLGVDIGGTSIKFGVVDFQGRSLGKAQIPTLEERGAADATRRTFDAATELLTSLGLARERLAAVGLASPGTQDLKAGTLLHPHNLPHWYHAPIRKLFEDAFGLPVSYANDANAAAYGEKWVGSGRAFHSIVMLTLGTGVGGGIIIGDLNLEGDHSHGSECGHIIVDSSPDARMCGCGHAGHLEAYCSATALIKRAQESLDTGHASSLRERLTHGDTLSGLLIAQEANRGDVLAWSVIEELAGWLGRGCASLIHAIDPGAVILGGNMNFGGESTLLGKRFIDVVRATARARVFSSLAPHIRIEFATLGGNAGTIGAAGLARSLCSR